MPAVPLTVGILLRDTSQSDPCLCRPLPPPQRHTRYPSINEVVLTVRSSGLVLFRVSEHGPDLAPHPPKEVGAA